MEMVRNILMCAGILAGTLSEAAAADFTLAIGNPIAASGPTSGAAATGAIVKKVGKNALFAVRFEQCASLDTAQITGLAEGVVAGVRTSAPVMLLSAGSPGVYLASMESGPNQGVWVVSLSATCGSAKAGALVSIGPQGFIRERTKLLPRPATKAEIDGALKALQSPSN
jgi:hypothetical protein